MIKLIATDMDGTLFYPKMRIRGIPPKNRKFLKKYLSDGGKLLLVSGRNGRIIPKVEKQLGRKVSLIGCNGAFYFENGKYHNEMPVNREKLLELFAFLHRDYGAWIWMLFDKGENLYCNTCNIPEWVSSFAQIGNSFSGFFAENLITDEKQFMEHLTNYDTFKVMICFGIKENGKRKTEQALPVVKKYFGDYFEVVTSHNVIEITAKNANKGAMLTEYCQNNGYSPEEVVVIGDSGNDLTMFARFPHSFAMSHGKEYFKEQANHVIDSVSDVQEYLSHPELMEKDKIKEINYQKALEK